MAYGSQLKGWCSNCCKYGHKSTDTKCLQNKNEDKDETKMRQRTNIWKTKERKSSLENIVTIENMCIKVQSKSKCNGNKAN